MVPVEQPIRYASVDGCSIAWTSTGSGPVLIVGGWWCSHLRLDWENVAFRRFVDALAEHRTVVRYDRIGVGLSGGDPGPVTLDREVATLTGIVDTVGERRVALFGASSGGPVVARFAAEFPTRVDRIAIYGSYANGADIAPPEARASIIDLVTTHWGVGSKFLADMFLPDAGADDRSDFVQFQRESATSAQAAAALAAVYEFDARPWLPAIRTPTLVLHRRQDRAIPFTLGRRLAAGIAEAQFTALGGFDHYPWRGDADAVLAALGDFLGTGHARVSAPRPPALSDRERDVLALVADGLTDQEIADALTLSPHTVHRHVANIRTKLGVSTRAAAAAAAARRGLLR